MTKELSIIILSYNTKLLLKQCLQSIIKNKGDLDLEIIVVDNASRDGSVELARSEFPSLILIANKENRGFSAAVNQGLKICQGRYILLLNSDTLIIGDALTLMIRFLQENPGAGAVRPRVLNPDGTLQRQGSGILRIFHSPQKTRTLKWISGCCLMTRDEVIADVGLFDEHFFFYNEDLDYSRRLKKKGWKIYYYPRARIIHHWGASAKENEEELIIEGYRGGYYYCQKHFGNVALFFYKMLALIEIMIKIIVQSFSLQKEKAKKRIKTMAKIIALTLK